MQRKNEVAGRSLIAVKSTQGIKNETVIELTVSLNALEKRNSCPHLGKLSRLKRNRYEKFTNFK